MTKIFSDASKIFDEYQGLRESAENFSKDCHIYDDFYDGEHWKHNSILFSNGWNLENTFIEDAVRVQENHCDEVVDINTEILMNNPPIFRVPKPQEEDPFVDVDPYEEDEDEAQTDQITDIEKCLRLILNKTKYHKELENGACDGSLYGRTLFIGKIFNNKEYGKLGGFKSKDPTKVRVKFRTGEIDEIEKIFWSEKISISEAKKRYKEYIKENEFEFFTKEDYLVSIKAEGMADTGWANLAYESWRNEQEDLNPMISVIHCYDAENYYVILKDRFIFQEEHKIGRRAQDGTLLPPVWYIPNAPMGKMKGLGQSDIRRIIPTQILINKEKSLEYNLISGNVFPSKELISNRAGILETIKGAKSFDIRLIPGESINFKTPQINNFPLDRLLKEGKQHIRDATGMTNAVYGDPEGSINTGPALKIQYHPAERKILRKTIFWIPELMSLYSWLLEITAKNNPRFAELIHFKGKPYTMVDVYWEVKTPQDESIGVTNDVNLVDRGIISKESVARKRGVKNVEYEMRKIAMEKMIDAGIEAEAKAKIMGQGAPAQQGAEGAEAGPSEAGPSEEEQLQSSALADQENYQMASGQEVPPTDPASVPDFKAHNARHLEFINSPQYDLLPDGVKELFARHLENAQEQGGEFTPATGTQETGGGTPGPEAENNPTLDQSQNKKEDHPLSKVPLSLQNSPLLQKGSPKRMF